MCRDILNTCIRNTEEAERNAQPSSANSTSGRGQGKGVWGMIEESKLAKTFRKGDEKKVESRSPYKSLESLLIPGGTQNESEAVVQAQRYKDQLQELLARSTTSGRGTSKTQADLELIERVKALLPTFAEIIGTCSDSARLDELLSLNDTLISLLAHSSPKPKPSLQGLGIELNGLGDPSTGPNGADNGSRFLDDHVVTPRDDTEEPEEHFDEDSPSTPRLDKGKGKAPPEPEIVEAVLSPGGFAVADSEEEEGGHETEQGESDPCSPTDL